RAERAVTVTLPDVEVLLDTVDLDGFEHDVDRRRAKASTRERDQRQPESPRDVETGQVLEPEELLPEGDVPRLDRNQRLERAAQPRRSKGVQRAVERKVEDLVENEAAAEPRVESRRGHRV